MSDVIPFCKKPIQINEQPAWEDTEEYQSLSKLIKILRDIRLAKINSYKTTDPERYKKEIKAYNKKIYGPKDELWEDRALTIVLKDGKAYGVAKGMDTSELDVIPLPRRID